MFKIATSFDLFHSCRLDNFRIECIPNFENCTNYHAVKNLYDPIFPFVNLEREKAIFVCFDFLLLFFISFSLSLCPLILYFVMHILCIYLFLYIVFCNPPCPLLSLSLSLAS